MKFSLYLNRRVFVMFGGTFSLARLSPPLYIVKDGIGVWKYKWSENSRILYDIYTMMMHLCPACSVYIDLFFGFVLCAVLRPSQANGVMSRAVSIPNHTHYENMPIQIYWKFYLLIKKIFRQKNSDFFFSYFCSKHILWVIVRIASPRRF